MFWDSFQNHFQDSYLDSSLTSFAERTPSDVPSSNPAVYEPTDEMTSLPAITSDIVKASNMADVFSLFEADNRFDCLEPIEIWP